MGASQTSSTTQQATQTADPRMQAAVAPILGQVQNVWQTPYSESMSPQVAAQNAQQIQAIQGLGGLQTNNPASPFINQAAYYSNQAADPNNVIRMQEAFYNPMASAVQAQLGNTFGQQNAQLIGNAAASGSTGGSRYGVAAGNLANAQILAAGQTFAGLQDAALRAAQTQQGQISQQAFTQGNLGQEALGTALTGINAALQGGNLTQAQQQAILNAAQTGAIQRTLFPQQELGAAANIAGIGTTLGGQSYGTGQTSTPVNYLGQILGGLTAGAGLIASDERVKENIEPIGKSFDKQTIYKFNYIGDPTTRIGLMAQEVQKKHPSAVKSINGAKAVDYGKATAKSAEIGEHRLHRDAGGDVRVPETHFPQLNLNPQPPQQQSGNSGSRGGLPGIGGLGNLSSLGDGLSSLGSSAIEGIGSLGSAIGSGIGELGGAIGGALEGAGEFLPMLALLRDGGSVRQHRAIGGGTGVGLGDQGVAALGGMPNPSSSGLNYNGIQSPLAPYFAQSPQVHVPQMNFPQLNMGQQGGNQAQQQQDQTAKQWSDFGSALKQNNVLGNADQALFADFGGGGADFARGGRIHRDMGGGLFSLSPEDKAQLDYLRGGAPSWLGGDTGNTPPPIGPSALERFLNERRSAALHGTPQDYDAQPQSAPPQPLLQNASLTSNPIPIQSKPIQDRLQSTPPPLADEPTVVKSETYRPDGTQVQPAGFTPAPIGATPPSVSQPKAAPQYGRNQQPQWETPEWSKWADGYGRVSIQGETGHTSAFQGLKEINTHDTNGSHSYGNYGLNSGGSAQEFVRQYGLESIGLTAQPGTPMFDWQWREAASSPVTANVLRRAEIDYYNNHYVDPTVRGMSQYLPVNIANNRAAQEYMIDKSVQQGAGVWDDNSAKGINHIRRAQQAAEESGGDPVKFVNRMAQLDHAAVGSDFPAALRSGAYSPLGDLNRLHTRVAGALGELGEGIQAIPGQIGEGIRGVFGGGQKPQSVLDRADLQPPKPGESNLDQRLREFGFNVGQPQGLGGSLGRALGINSGLDPQTSNRLVNLGLGMMAAGPTVGVKGFPGAAISALTSAGKGGQFALQQEQNERAQAINLANAAMNQKLHEAQIRHYNMESQKPFVARTTAETVVDPTTGMVIGTKNINHYAQFDENGKMHWVDEQTNNALNGQPSTPGTPSKPTMPDLDTIPGTGDDLVRSLKQAGYSPTLVDAANQVANYKTNPTQIASRSRHEQLFIDRLAHRINPDYDTTKYPAVLASEKTLTTGRVSQGLASTGRLFDEIEIASDRARKLHNWGSEYANAVAGQVYPSQSDYQAARTGMSTAINNVADAAAAAAKGGAQGAEGDAKRRVKLMNPDMHEKPLLQGLQTEAETALKMGQSNLNPYNAAHGFTPDNPKYKTIMDYMTPAQQKKAVNLLGPEMIEDITGKPVPANLLAPTQPKQSAASGSQSAPAQAAIPPRPAGKSDDQLKREAQEAIAQHPDAAGAVNARLKAWGIE